ncbi:hypothetical protein [Holospora undulata]|nr:hypothetical protein [Holospora undulata]
MKSDGDYFGHRRLHGYLCSDGLVLVFFSASGCVWARTIVHRVLVFSITG